MFPVISGLFLVANLIAWQDAAILLPVTGAVFAYACLTEWLRRRGGRGKTPRQSEKRQGKKPDLRVIKGGANGKKRTEAEDGARKRAMQEFFTDEDSSGGNSKRLH